MALELGALSSDETGMKLKVETLVVPTMEPPPPEMESSPERKEEPRAESLSSKETGMELPVVKPPETKPPVTLEMEPQMKLQMLRPEP
jgi:hypothetical protein